MPSRLVESVALLLVAMLLRGFVPNPVSGVPIALGGHIPNPWAIDPLAAGG